MPWNDVITNIVTNSTGTVDLSTVLSSYYLATTTDSLLGQRVAVNNGTASNLSLSSEGTNATSVITKGTLDAAVTTLNATLAGKANLNAPTFTGSVTVPTAVSAGNPVRLDQLGNYLSSSGGNIGSGTISTDTDPTDPTHLVRKQYVDTNFALATDFNALSIEVDGKADVTTLDNYLELDGIGQHINTVVTAVNPATSDSSQQLATTAWVQGEFATVLPSKADLDSPNFTGTPQVAGTNVATTTFVNSAIATGVANKANIDSPTLTGTPSTTAPAAADNSTRIPTTGWVQNLIDSSFTTRFASPVFSAATDTGSITPNDDSQRVATTAWVQALLVSKGIL